MRIHKVVRKQLIKTDLQTAWEFFSSPSNLLKITPPELNFKIICKSGGPKMYTGQIISYKVNVLPLVQMTWVTEITHVEEPFYFIDEQRFGPCKFWHHKHHFRSVEGSVEITDEIDYALPLGILGRIAQGLFAGRQVNRIFDYRHKVLEELFNPKG